MADKLTSGDYNFTLTEEACKSPSMGRAWIGPIKVQNKTGFVKEGIVGFEGFYRLEIE